jgi:hypothetical protein
MPISSHIHQFVSAPMIALLQSEWQAAKTTLEFIENVGFSSSGNSEESHYGEVKTVTFHYKQPDTGRQMELEIPLLSLIPIPYLQVSEAAFDFGMMIRPRKSGSATSERFISELTSRSTRGKKNLEMNVQVVQAPLPAGLQHLLQQVQTQAQEVAIGQMTLEPTSSPLDFKGEEEVTVKMEVQVFDAQGIPKEGVYIAASYVRVLTDWGSYQPDDFDYSNQKHLHTQEDGKLRFTFTLRKSELGQSTPDHVQVMVQLPPEEDSLHATALVPLTY